MKKASAVSLLILLTVLAITPVLLGHYTEKHLRQLSQQLALKTNTQISWEQYSRGYFSSHGILLVNTAAADNASPNPNTRLTLRVNIKHPANIFDSSMPLQLIQADLSRLTSPKTIAELSITLDGSLHIEANPPKLQLENKHQRLDISMPSITFDHNIITREFSLSGQFKAFDIERGDGFLSAELIHFHSHGKLDWSTPWATGLLNFQAKKIRGKYKTDFQIAALTLESTIESKNKGTLKHSLNFAIKDLKTSSLPEKIDDISAALSIHQLNQTAVIALLNRSNDQQQHIDAPYRNNPQFEKHIATHIKQILAEPPHIKIDAISIQNHGESLLHLNGRAELSANRMTDYRLIKANPILLLPALNSTLECQFSESLKQGLLRIATTLQPANGPIDAEQIFKALVNNGHITESKQGYITKLALHNSQLSMNNTRVQILKYIRF